MLTLDRLSAGKMVLGERPLRARTQAVNWVCACCWQRQQLLRRVARVDGPAYIQRVLDNAYVEFLKLVEEYGEPRLILLSCMPGAQEVDVKTGKRCGFAPGTGCVLR